MIKILSRAAAIKLISEQPDFPIIIIGETRNDDYERLSSVAKNALTLRFDDIKAKRQGYKLASRRHIEQALEWSKDKGDMAVACQAGRARSSALAFLIEASRTSPDEALSILDDGYHCPNSHIINIGKFLIDAETGVDKAMAIFESKVWRRLHREF